MKNYIIVTLLLFNINFIIKYIAVGLVLETFIGNVEVKTNTIDPFQRSSAITFQHCEEWNHHF